MGSVYSVGQVNSYIKNMFVQDYALRNISIKGEVSNCKYHTSGHIYFNLKDSTGVISGIMFAANRRNGLKFRLQEGQSVVASGSVNVYERDGKYQLYAKSIELDGTGQLYQKFDRLKSKLEEMGMFDPMYKKPIPKYAVKIGIVTASTGAAIQDIINISRRRNPYMQLILFPAQVQGEGAVGSIVNGIRCLDAMNLDTIIVGRGGGSIEDLWAFNEEEVARAIFDCNTPIISAVGHETDTTIADYVADMRAPTPSAAAELAVFSYNDFIENLYNINFTLNRCFTRNIENKKLKIDGYMRELKYLNPSYKIVVKKQEVNDILISMQNIIAAVIDKKKNELAVKCERLNGLSPLNKLGGGFAYVSDERGMPLLKVDDIKLKECVNINLKDGNIKAAVTEIEKGTMQYGK